MKIEYVENNKPKKGRFPKVGEVFKYTTNDSDLYLRLKDDNRDDNVFNITLNSFANSSFLTVEKYIIMDCVLQIKGICNNE